MLRCYKVGLVVTQKALSANVDDGRKMNEKDLGGESAELYTPTIYIN